MGGKYIRMPFIPSYKKTEKTLTYTASRYLATWSSQSDPSNFQKEWAEIIFRNNLSIKYPLPRFVLCQFPNCRVWLWNECSPRKSCSTAALNTSCFRIHLIIHSENIFTEQLWYARLCSRNWEYSHINGRVTICMAFTFSQDTETRRKSKHITSNSKCWEEKQKWRKLAGNGGGWGSAVLQKMSS